MWLEREQKPEPWSSILGENRLSLPIGLRISGPLVAFCTKFPSISPSIHFSILLREDSAVLPAFISAFCYRHYSYSTPLFQSLKFPMLFFSLLFPHRMWTWIADFISYDCRYPPRPSINTVLLRYVFIRVFSLYLHIKFFWWLSIGT